MHLPEAIADSPEKNYLGADPKKIINKLISLGVKGQGVHGSWGKGEEELFVTANWIQSLRLAKTCFYTFEVENSVFSKARSFVLAKNKKTKKVFKEDARCFRLSILFNVELALEGELKEDIIRHYLKQERFQGILAAAKKGDVSLESLYVMQQVVNLFERS